MFNIFKSGLNFILGGCEPERDHRGKFIAIEGIDGIGKTTLAHHLVELFKNDGVDAEYMSFPIRSTSTGLILDDYLKGVREYNKEIINHLFLQNRTEALEYIHDTIYNKKRVIVCDRFWMSGVAYSMARGMSEEECIKSEDHRVINLPDITIILDGVDAALNYLRKKSIKEVTENEEFLKKVSEAYVHIFNRMKKDGTFMYNISSVGDISHHVYRDIKKHIKVTENF
jgi:dTMP kinase